MPPATLAIAVCFFLSGAAGLVYEVVWSRHLNLIFGSTTWSITTVVATYMFGLGIGSLLFGKVADRSARPLRLYARLEIAIGVYALLSPLLLGAIRWVFLVLHRALEPGPALGVAVKAVLAFLVLSVPTLLMGGTLPILARFVVARGGETSRGIGLLYALNTLGAVTGSALAGFLLVERLGLFRSLVAAATINFLVGAIALLLRTEPLEVAAEAKAATPPLRLLREPVVRQAALLALLTGFASLAAEVVWTRVLTLVVGSSTYAFTLVLVVFLLGIGLGSWVVARTGGGSRPAGRIAAAQLLAAAGGIAFFWLLRPLVALLIAFQQNPLAGFRETFALKAVLVLAALLPATIGMGITFPLVATLAARTKGAVGEEVGMVYAANTLGSILGALGAGFVLLSRIGSFATLRLAVAVHAVAALVALAAGFPALDRTRRVAVALVAVVLGTAFVKAEPWPPHLLSSGAYLYARGVAPTRDAVERFLEVGKGNVPFFREGLSAVVAVWDFDYTKSLRIGGKADASTGGDMETQIALGFCPVLAHPAPHDVLIIGAGSGVTARAVAADPRVRSIDVVEIERAVVDAGAEFRDVNGGIYDDPRVHLIYEDGRNWLLTTTKRYDVIVSEPSNPWMAGVANLFTREFYALVRSRLNDGGVFGQWIQQYDLASATLKRMGATLSAEFPHLELWRVGSGDLQAICSTRPIVHSLARARSLLDGTGPWRRDLKLLMEVHEPSDLLANLVLDHAGIASWAGAAVPFADNPPELEFKALRTLGDRRLGPRVFSDLIAARASSPPVLNIEEPLPPGFADYQAGRVLFGWGLVAEALPAFERAAAADPGSARYARWVAEARYRGGFFPGVVEACTRAVGNDPALRSCRNRLAELAMGAGRLDEAAGHLAAIDPADADAPTWMLEAEVAVRGKDYERALERASRVVARLREVPAAPALVARVIGVYQQAVAGGPYADRVLAAMQTEAAHTPGSSAWPYQIATLLELKGNPADARRTYERLLERGPEPQALLGLARTSLALGDEATARKALDVIRGFDPSDPGVAAIARQMAAPGAR